MTFQEIQAKYSSLLHAFVVGLIHDEIESHSIVALCFDFLQKNYSEAKDETTAWPFLENIARKLCINYINKKSNEGNRDTERQPF